MAEEEEKISYEGRMSDQWLKDLEPLGTNWEKEFIDIVPWIIVVFKRTYEFGENNEKLNNYYVNESVGLACGFLIAAIHNAGLATLNAYAKSNEFLSESFRSTSKRTSFPINAYRAPGDRCKGS